MFSFFANLFGYVLNAIYGVVNNYGVAIIIFTILLKAILLPISIKQQKTMKKSTKIQAQVKELQEKYSNDPVRLNQEMMDVYKRENMSPFSGCLSSLVQFIIILSMFYLVSRPLTYMKHIDADTINSYVAEITENSESTVRYSEIAVIKEYSDVDENVNINMNFLGLDLSDIPSQNYTDFRVFIIPILYVITSVFSTKLATSLNNDKKDEKDKKEEISDKPEKTVKEKDEQTEADAMAEMNKQMSIMMPVMAVSIALIAPLGLALYWLISNLMTISERLVINKFFKKEEEE